MLTALSGVTDPKPTRYTGMFSRTAGATATGTGWLVAARALVFDFDDALLQPSATAAMAISNSDRVRTRRLRVGGLGCGRSAAPPFPGRPSISAVGVVLIEVVQISMRLCATNRH